MDSPSPFRTSFMSGSDRNIDDGNRELACWALQIAGCRMHGMTGARPLEVFAAVTPPERLLLGLTGVGESHVTPIADPRVPN